jgi:hypothetical protein
VFDFSPSEITAGGFFGWGEQTVGYKYYVGLHVQVCLAADGIKQIWFADRPVWPVLYDATVEAADATVSASIDAIGAFGGEQHEGGIYGTIYIQYGAAAQGRNSYLQSKLGTGIPAYRGMLGMIWEHLYIGTTSYVKPMTVLAKRTDILCDHTEMWYIAKANIGDDHLNAIHVLYEMLTSRLIGCGKSTSLIGDSFATAADICYDEGLGLDICWDSAPDDVQSMIDHICDIIDGALYQDLSTGKFEIGLARDDYDPGDLDVYDESYFWVEQMEYPSPGKTPSKTIVRFHDRASTKTRPAYDDDIALMEVQGNTPVTQEFDYSGFIADEVLANTVAARMQTHASAMPKTLILVGDRRMADLHKNSVFKINYTELGITEMIVRVVGPEYGSVREGSVRLTVVEDIYGDALTTYGAPPLRGSAPTDDPVIDFQWACDPATGTLSYGGRIYDQGHVYCPVADSVGTTDQYIWWDRSDPYEWQHGSAAPTAPGTFVVADHVGCAVNTHHTLDKTTDPSELPPTGANWRCTVDGDDQLILQHTADDGATWDDQGTFDGAGGMALDNLTVNVRATIEELLTNKDAAFDAAYDNGNSGATKTIDWTNGNKQTLTLTGAPGCTVTFTAPAGAANLVLLLVQGSGGSKTATWPATAKWPSGTAPTLSTTAGAVDMICAYWDGAGYHCAVLKDFKVPA